MPSVAKRSIPGAWRIGPEHPDHEYVGAYGYPVLAPSAAPIRKPRRSQWNGGKLGPIMARRYSLTPEGALAVSRAGSAGAEPPASCAQPAEASSGHANCPAVLGCRSGRLPAGWVRERRDGVA